MRTDIWSRRVGWFGMLAWVLFSGAVARAQTERQTAEEQQDRAVEKAQKAERAARDNADEAPQPGEYWIGVATSDELINETVRAQLGLDNGQGLAVLSVRPESPAAQAGMKENDVLVKAGDRELKGVEDLVAAVEGSKGSELKVELYRQGKLQTLTLTPAKRPADMQRMPQDTLRNWVRRRAGGGPDDVLIERWLSDKEGGPLGMLMVRPGMVLPPGARSQPLPDNMRITITKQGKDPAKISVRRGDDSWEVTEEKLSELPDDVRAHVDMMLARHPAGFNVRVAPPTVQPLPPRTVVPYVTPLPDGDHRTDAGQLNDVQKQVKELQQSVEELKRLIKEKNE